MPGLDSPDIFHIEESQKEYLLPPWIKKKAITVYRFNVYTKMVLYVMNQSLKSLNDGTIREVLLPSSEQMMGKISPEMYLL